VRQGPLKSRPPGYTIACRAPPTPPTSVSYTGLKLRTAEGTYCIPSLFTSNTVAMVGGRSKVFELPFSGALLGRESAGSLASKATLLTDVSRRHWWSGEKQPPGHMENSLVLLFEVTFRFQAACFRHTAPPNVRMAKISRHTVGLYSRSLKNLARQQSQNSYKSAFTGSQRPIRQSGATVGVRGFCENGSSVGSPPSQRLAWILRHKSDRWAPRSAILWR